MKTNRTNVQCLKRVVNKLKDLNRARESQDGPAQPAHRGIKRQNERPGPVFGSTRSPGQIGSDSVHDIGNHQTAGLVSSLLKDILPNVPTPDGLLPGTACLDGSHCQ